MCNDEVLTVRSDEFRANYDLYEDYDDLVIHKTSRQVYKLNFINGMAQLVPVSNEAAITKIESGMQSFVDMLKEQGF